MKPGTQTSEWKLAILTMGATLLTAGAKALGVAAAATGQWWAIPISLAVTSAGYSLSRAMVKRGVLPEGSGVVTPS